MLPSAKKGLRRSSNKTSAVWLVEFSCTTATKSLRKLLADPTWVQQQDMVCADFCAVSNKNKAMSGLYRTRTRYSPLLLNYNLKTAKTAACIRNTTKNKHYIGIDQLKKNIYIFCTNVYRNHLDDSSPCTPMLLYLV